MDRDQKESKDGCNQRRGETYDYWTHQASRPTGSKKDKMRQRLRKGEYVEHAKHVVEKTQTECYKEFQQLHPEIKIKQ